MKKSIAASKKKKRRDYPRLLFYGLILLVALYGFFAELHWVKIVTIKLNETPSFKLVHVSDFHYRGDKSYVKGIIHKINTINPDVVCFTGDLVDKNEYLPELLSFIKEINYPVIGVPGNHDYWGKLNFDEVQKAFEATGGKWLLNESFLLNDTEFFGATNISSSKPLLRGKRKILLCHYPVIADSAGSRFDLILAGHTHGGQVRIPFLGAIILPYQSGDYSKGLYNTVFGKLHVSPGLGWWFIPVRFCCRPEITILEL